MAKSSQSGANYGMKLDLSDAIAKLKALQDEMKKTFGTAGEGGTVIMKLGLDVSDAERALKDLVAKPLTVRININPGDVKSQIQKAIGSLTVSPRADRANQLFSEQPKIQRAIQQGSGSSYQPGTSIVPYESFKPYERIIENAFRATVPPSYDAGGNRVYSDAMMEVYKQQSRAMNVVPNSGYTYWESAYRGNINAVRNARYIPNWSQDFASTSREIQAASTYAKTHYEAPYQYQQRYTPNWQAGTHDNGRGWYDYTSKLFGNTSDQKPFQTWGMTNTPGYAKPWEQQKGAGVNPFGLYMFSNTMSTIATKLEGMFRRIEESYDTSALSFRKTQLVSGMSSDQFEGYKNSLLDLAGQTMTSVPTLAEMGYSFATRGYMKPETAESVLRPLAISGLITGEDPVQMGKSVMSLAQAWNPQDLTSLEQRAPELIGNFSDMMTYAYANSPLETRWFKDIANYAAPVFAGLGFEPTETMSTFMAMSQMIPTPGIGARSARMAVSNLFDVNKLGTVSDKYGIDLQSDINAVRESGGGLAEVFQKLAERINSLPEWEQNSFMRTVGGGVRGGMALQALLPVIGNIQGYQRKIEAEAEGYTYMKEIDYRSTPYGQLKQVEAEREAILYGTGEKTVGVRTAIMKLENTMLKFIQKLPEPVLSAGYSAGKGFEAMGGITSSVANLAIINALGKKGGMLGNLGPVLTGASLAVPIATAVAGALATSIQEGKRQDDEEWSEENKGLDPLLAAQNTMRNIKYLTEDDQNALTSNTPLYIGDSIYGDTPGEGISKMFLRSFGKSYSFMEGGEIQDQEFVSNRLRMIEELYAQSQENVIKRLPMDEESKDALSKKMSAENDWMQTINLASLDPNNVIEALKSTGKTFGDMSGLEEDDYVGRQKRTYDNIEKYIGDLGIDPSKLPDTGDIRLPESLISMRNMLLNKQGDTTWGDDDVMNLSKEEIRKGITEHFSTDAYKGLDAETKQDVVQYYVDAIQKLTDISGNFNEIKQIIENINNNTAELTQSEEAAYMEQFAAWKSGATSLDVLPGPNGAYMKGIWDEEGNMYPMAGGLFNQDMRSEYERHNDALRSHLPNGGEGFEFPMDTYKEGKVGVDIRALFNVADMGNKIVQSFDTLGTIFSGALNRGGPL